MKLGSAAANAFTDGLIRANVIPTAKHFPGHGFASGDTHKVLAESTSNQELESFKSFFTVAGIKAVMMAHVAYPELDPSGAPASLSYPIVTEFLREKLQFNGLVITDDLEMEGVNDVAPLGERVVQSFAAGCDMIMIAWSESAQKIAYQKLLEAVRSGRISEERLNESVERILNAKNSVITETNTPPYSLTLSRLEKLTRKVAKVNFNQLDTLSLEKMSTKKLSNVIVVTSDERFYQEFSTAWKKTPVHFYKLNPKTNFRPNKLSTEETLFIYYVTGPGSAKILKSWPASQRSRTLVINASHPDFIANRSEFFAVIQMNTPFYESAKWLAQKLNTQTVLRVAELPQ